MKKNIFILIITISLITIIAIMVINKINNSKIVYETFEPAEEITKKNSSVYDSHEILYSIKNNNDELVFINENGNIAVKFDKAEYDYAGVFKEGKVFLVKELKKISQDGMYDKVLSKLAIMDYTGKIIKALPFYGIVYIYGNDDPIPEYRDNKACIELENGKSIFVDKNGEYISDSEVPFYEYFEDINVNEWYVENKNLALNPSKIYPIDTEGPFPDFIDTGKGECKCDFGCINYKNKAGEIVIKSNFCSPGGSGDFTRDPYFYNGIATVFENEDIPKRRFIDMNGNYINNEVYEYSTPFWNKLAYVITDKEYGYINTKGEWVFKQKLLKKDVDNE